jgi:hypothetical protein
VPEDKAQENFTDPDSRIMKRAASMRCKPISAKPPHRR